MAIENMSGIFRCRKLAPDGHGINPGMNLKTLAVCGFENGGKTVELTVVSRILHRRFKRLGVQSVTSTPNLYEKGIDIGAFGIGNQLRHFLDGTNTCMKSVHPESPYFSYGRTRQIFLIGAMRRRLELQHRNHEYQAS
jgi:hypothetical protein